MGEQRDKLLAMKKAERDKKVRLEEERQAELRADGDDTETELKLRAQAQAAGISKEESKGGEGINVADEKKRSAMRLALARRMKLDLMESEELKVAKHHENQFSDLDRKLQLVSKRFICQMQ